LVERTTHPATSQSDEDTLLVEAQSLRQSSQGPTVAASGHRVAGLSGATHDLFVMRLGDVYVAVVASAVVRVLAALRPVPLPRAPSYLLGLLPFEDTALPVIDLAGFLGLARPRDALDLAESNHRVAVIDAAGLRAGLLCDQAVGLAALDANALMAPTVLRTGELMRYLSAEFEGRHGRTGLLNTELLLEDARIRSA
jgi:chemotaxis signal transduction protein